MRTVVRNSMSDDAQVTVGKRTIRVVIVDDSKFIRKALSRMLADHPAITIAGSAGSGEELLANLEKWRPDVLTLDLEMPGMGGLEALDRVMQARPLPIIILSTHSGAGAPQTMEALHRGAFDFIDKQRFSLVDFASLRAILLDKIFAATRGLLDEPEPPPKVTPMVEPISGEYRIVGIGASTGGPPIVQRILEGLGSSVPVPIVVVQHMPLGFTGAFAERLNAHIPLQVCEAGDRETLRTNTVYIAPAGWHLRVRAVGGALVASLDQYPPSTHVPSVDILFESISKSVGRRSIGILLTGMGRDGAYGLASMKVRGAHTFCQDEESCVVFGMPRAAIASRAASEVAAPPQILRRLRELVGIDKPA